RAAAARRRGRRRGMRPPAFPPRASWQPLLERALAEDLGAGDATSNATLPAGALGAAVVEARAEHVVCGLPIAEAVFAAVDPALEVKRERAEGETCAPAAGEGPLPLLRVRGALRSILAAERTALNFLQRTCGV